MLSQPSEPDNWPTPQVMSFQSLASMLMIMTIAALSTFTVVSRCSWTWCFTFAGSRSTPCVEMRPWCIKDGINQCYAGFLRCSFTKCVKKNVCWFRWLMSLYMMMLMLPGEQNFITFMGGPMQLLLLYSRKKKNNNYNYWGIWLINQSIFIWVIQFKS